MATKMAPRIPDICPKCGRREQGVRSDDKIYICCAGCGVVWGLYELVESPKTHVMDQLRLLTKDVKSNEWTAPQPTGSAVADWYVENQTQISTNDFLYMLTEILHAYNQEKGRN